MSKKRIKKTRRLTDLETLFATTSAAQCLYDVRNWRKHCFQAAATLMTELPPSVNAKVVHGLPTGQGGDAAGQIYLHAWVEVEDAVVFDITGGPKPVPKLIYYALGQIRTVVEFTRDQVHANIDAYGHYGPWPESPKGITLEQESK